MTNRAQSVKAYNIDMFTSLPTGTRITYTDEGAPAGYYIGYYHEKPADDKFCKVLIPTTEFSKYFKYYTQATLF